MPISSQNRKAGPFVGNGTVATFPFTFKVFQASDLQLVKLNSTTNVETQLVLTTDYTVSLNSNQNTNPGGTITLTAGVLPTGFKLTITTNIAPLQAVDLTNSGGFYPSVINAALDKLTILVQQIIERAGRTLTLPLSTPTDVSTSLPAPQAKHLIGWDNAGKSLQNYDSQALATVVAYGTARGDQFTGDGVTTQFNLSNNPGALNNLDVSVGGVTQIPGDDYTWASGTLLTFTSAPPLGAKVFVRYMQGLPFGVVNIDNVVGVIGRDELASGSGASAVGFVAAPAFSVNVDLRTKLRRDWLMATDCGISTAVDNRDGLIDLMEWCAANGRTLYLPDGVYGCGDWLPLPSGLKMVFAPGAWLKLTADTGPIGGFLAGGYDESLTKRPFAGVEIHGLALDLNNIAGENGFNAVNASNVRVFNPKLKNGLHSPTRLGGRAFQFEGGEIDGVHIYQPHIENFSIGINSQGNPSGAEIARSINYYDVVMRNVDIPFNVDSQYANPETNSASTMSTFVHGAHLFNCGKIRWPGDTSSGMGGGIICGDRGAGLRVSGLRVVNEAAYGGIGALLRGTLYDVALVDADVDVPSMTAILDTSVVGFGSPSFSAAPSRVNTAGVRHRGNLDYIVKGGGNGVGASALRGVEIDSALASLGGVADTSAGSSTGYLELILRDQGFKSSGLRALSDIYAAGNSIGVCQPVDVEGTWTPIDASGAGLSLTVIGTPWFVRKGRMVTATCALTWPTTSSTDTATIGGLPVTAANFSSMAGAGAIGYCTESTLASAYVIGNTATALPTTAAGVGIQNAALSGDTLYITFTYFG